MDNISFFKSENKDILYNLCRDELYRDTNYNIDENKKYYKTFGEIMKIVYKHSDTKENLTLLNKAVLGKTIPYLKEEILKKNLNNKPLLPKDYNQRKHPKKYENLLDRNLDNIKDMPVSFRATPTKYDDNINVNDTYENILKSREIKKEIQKPINFEMNNKEYMSPENLMEKNIKERQNIILNNDNYEIDSFNLDNKTKEDLFDNNIRNDINTNLDLNIDETKDPLKLYEEKMNSRIKQNEEYMDIQKDKIDFEEAQNSTNQQMDNLFNENINKKNKDEEDKFQTSLTYQLNKEMNNINVDELKGQLDNRIDNIHKPKNPPVADDRIQTQKLLEENKLFEEFKKKIFNDKKYINRENLICINSGDRDWFSDTTEHRYNFQVRFKPARDFTSREPKMVDGVVQRDPISNGIIYETKTFKGEQGCGIETIYKNIVSIELVRVLMPVENFIIPFDNRIFIDYKSLPYIVLKIAELDGLYSGTNSNIQGSFAKLLWDKDHSSEVIVDTGILNGDKKSFSRQLKRGYSSMAPMSFEKKTFYPSPLSTLNRLTLELETPYGSNIKNHDDVYTVSNIKYQDLGTLTSLELDDTICFPYTDTSSTNTLDKILEITVSGHFNNRVFKIGDNIVFKNFVLKSSTETTSGFEDFINREKGHYIINLEKETNIAGATGNSGYLTKLYISPPGDIDYTQTTGTDILQNSSAYTTMNTELKDSTVCKLINKSIQTHYVFKIITREEDVTSIMNTANI